jgi:predicted DNA-binding protein (MmcQ/YjbR family)
MSENTAIAAKNKMSTENSLRGKILTYVKKKYGTNPEYVWAKFPEYAIFRHADNQKWYGLLMNITYDKIDPGKCGAVDILNLKLNDLLLRDMLVQQEGYYPGYHISRGNWISIVLDGTVPLDAITHLIDVSFNATASKKKKQEIRPPKEWLIPSNPNYYDIVHAFDDTDVIDWKQGKGIKKRIRFLCMSDLRFLQFFTNAK